MVRISQRFSLPTGDKLTSLTVGIVGLVVMKIEIAESLIFSWLRHVQGCVVAQMNWKPSPRWPISNEDELRQKFERIRTLAGESIAVPIFKQGEFAQFVRPGGDRRIGASAVARCRPPRRRSPSTRRSTRQV